MGRIRKKRFKYVSVAKRYFYQIEWSAQNESWLLVQVCFYGKKCKSSFPLINILWLPQKSLGYLDDMIDPIDWCTGSMTLALMSFCSSLTA